DRDAVQRPPDAAGAHLRGRASRVLVRRVGHHGRVALQNGVETVDPLEDLLEQLGRGDRSGADRSRDLTDGGVVHGSASDAEAEASRTAGASVAPDTAGGHRHPSRIVSLSETAESYRLAPMSTRRIPATTGMTAPGPRH